MLQLLQPQHLYLLSTPFFRHSAQTEIASKMLIPNKIYIKIIHQIIHLFMQKKILVYKNKHELIHHQNQTNCFHVKIQEKTK